MEWCIDLVIKSNIKRVYQNNVSTAMFESKDYWNNKSQSSEQNKNLCTGNISGVSED